MRGLVLSLAGGAVLAVGCAGPPPVPPSRFGRGLGGCTILGEHYDYDQAPPYVPGDRASLERMVRFAAWRGDSITVYECFSPEPILTSTGGTATYCSVGATRHLLDAQREDAKRGWRKLYAYPEQVDELLILLYHRDGNTIAHSEPIEAQITAIVQEMSSPDSPCDP